MRGNTLHGINVLPAFQPMKPEPKLTVLSALKLPASGSRTLLENAFLLPVKKLHPWCQIGE